MTGWRLFGLILLCGSILTFVPGAAAHGVHEDDQALLEENEGVAFFVFLWLGAKHMVTGVDHLLFLAGVVFFLQRPRDVLLYVTLFTVGHSLTLLVGVLAELRVDASLVDAVIGLSVVYKAFDNLGGFKRILGRQPDTRPAVFVFGLFHGFGLATKLQEVQLASDGLVWNLLSFNLGVELGQVAALAAILGVLVLWRRMEGFQAHAYYANVLIMSGGFMFMGFHLVGWIVGGA
jgi:hypothetical protein